MISLLTRVLFAYTPVADSPVLEFFLYFCMHTLREDDAPFSSLARLHCCDAELPDAGGMG